MRSHTRIGALYALVQPRNLVWIGVCWLAACGAMTDGGTQSAHPAPTAGNLSLEHTGIWASDGYGFIVELGQGALLSYSDVTDTICQTATPAALEDVYTITAESLFRLSHDKQSLYISGPREPHEIRFQKIEALPKFCTSPAVQTKSTVFENFDAFTSYFSQHYAFFDIYNVDWAEQSRTARATITKDTSDAELFALMTQMLAPLKDGHIELNANINGEDKSYTPGHSNLRPAIQIIADREGVSRRNVGRRFSKTYWTDGIPNTILGSNSTLAGHGFIQYGLTSGDIGYINFKSEFGYSAGNLFEEEEDLLALHEILQAALRQFDEHHVKAVIIDLSINYGGYDFIAREIAGYFTNQRVRAYSKHARDSTRDYDFSLYVEPSKTPAFTGPVYVMTSNATVSAGEILTLSLRALPNVIHVGDSTRGALSDVLEKPLPNGWKITLSNEVYTDVDGVKWEGIGIAPQIDMPVFNPQQAVLDNFGPDALAKNHIEAIETLIGLIDERHPPL